MVLCIVALIALGLSGIRRADAFNDGPDLFSKQVTWVLFAIGAEQPTQKGFETQLWQAIEALDPARPVFVEAESRRIGKLQLPTAVLERMRASPCVELLAPVPARLAYLLQDYAYLGDDRAALAQQIGLLRGLHAHAVIDQWQAWAQAGELAPLFEALMVQHYDPAYARSQRGDFLRLAQAQQHTLYVLDDASLRALAQQLAAAG